MVMWRKLESSVSCNILANLTAPLIGLHNLSPCFRTTAAHWMRYSVKVCSSTTHLYSDISRHLFEDWNRDNYVKRYETDNLQTEQDDVAETL
jgi:hypothetical protein